MKRKSYLTNLISFCDEKTGVVNEGTAVDVVCLAFNRPFDTDSSNRDIDKLMKYGLEIWVVWWTEDWLNC